MDLKGEGGISYHVTTLVLSAAVALQERKSVSMKIQIRSKNLKLNQYNSHIHAMDFSDLIMASEPKRKRRTAVKKENKKKDVVKVTPILDGEDDKDLIEVEISNHPMTGRKCVVVSQAFSCHTAKIYLNVENLPAIISIIVNGGLEISRDSK